MKKIICLLVLVLCLVTSFGCTEEKVIKIGASPAPHAEILEQCREYVESKGYKLEIVEFEDYVLPNVGVTEGSLDANFFQHINYLDTYNQENGTEIVNVLKVHFEPLGIYSGKSDDLNNVKSGASVAIPNDSSNGERALLLLQDLKLITLGGERKGFWTKNNITDNPHNLNIVEIEAAQIPVQLPSFDFGIINGNYAIEGKVIDKQLAKEDPNGAGAQIYPNILCVQKGNEETEKTKILIEALSQEKIRNYINDNYQNIVVPII